MPARYPPIDRLPPIQALPAAEDVALTEAPETRAASGPLAPGAVSRSRGPRSQPLAGRLAGIDAFRGLAFLLFAWAILLPVPLSSLIGGSAIGSAPVWSGPGSALLGELRAGDLALPWAAAAAAWLPSLLLAAVLVATGAGLPLAAARRVRPTQGERPWRENNRFSLLVSLPRRVAMLVLLAVLVPLMRPETPGLGPSSALSLLALFGLVPLTLRLGPGITRAGRWTLQAGGLGICLLILCLRIDVPATRADPWLPDPIVLLLAWNGLFAALLWIITPGSNALAWALRVALGLLFSVSMHWGPFAVNLLGLGNAVETLGWDRRTLSGIPLNHWFFLPWLLGLGLVTLGTVVGDLGVRHLRAIAPAPRGALPRDEPEDVRWGAGGVCLMSLLLAGAPIVGIAMVNPVLSISDSVPAIQRVPAAAIAAAIALLPVLLARFLMIGRTDSAGRWARSLATLAGVLLIAGTVAGAGAIALGPLDMPAGEGSDLDLVRVLVIILSTVLGLSGGLVAFLAGLSAPLDRPEPVLPHVVALPLTGAGRNPLLVYALLAGPVIVAFGHPWLPFAPGEADWASIDAWVSFAIEWAWGPDASSIHGIGYGLFKTACIAVPVALLSRAGVVLRA